MKVSSPALTLDDALDRLNALANPGNTTGMARFGIHTDHALGVSMPALRAIAKGQRDHALALELWDTGIHEARILAGLVDDPAQVTRAQMERWACDFDSWDLVDQTCINLFERTPFALDCIFAWSAREEECVRRAAFTLIAVLAVHRKNMPAEDFRAFYPLILAASTDDRNFVRKAVNWALRGIGKRSPQLRAEAIDLARQVACIDSKAARWIAADALRELEQLPRPKN
jgi:3-methyladenine DNA glycosylase AlkD